MIIVDESEPIGDVPLPFPPRRVEVRSDGDIRDDYDMKKEIGRGRFGTVYLCNCRQTGLTLAAKFIHTKRSQDRKNVEREIEIMKLLHADKPHPKLIQLYDAWDMGHEMALVLEIVAGGELFERVIDDEFVLTETACVMFVKQVIEGVDYMHSRNILHLDMKPENILCISQQGNRIKICDFGLARKYDPRKKLQVLFGTPEFVAPEVVNFEPIGYGTDMWSVGVICYVLLSGLSPFLGHNYVETMTNVTHNKYDFDDEVFDDVSDEAKDFIENLLLLDKSDRLTPTQCLRHKWIRNAQSTCYMHRRRPSSADASSNETSESEFNEHLKLNQENKTDLVSQSVKDYYIDSLKEDKNEETADIIMVSKKVIIKEEDINTAKECVVEDESVQRMRDTGLEGAVRQAATQSVVRQDTLDVAEEHPLVGQIKQAARSDDVVTEIAKSTLNENKANSEVGLEIGSRRKEVNITVEVDEKVKRETRREIKTIDVNMQSKPEESGKSSASKAESIREEKTSKPKKETFDNQKEHPKRKMSTLEKIQSAFGKKRKEEIM